jgi:hypothetical protein
LEINYPQLDPQEALLLQPPPPMGLAELIENPDRMPASIKSILIDPQVSSRLLSTKNVRPSCSYVASFAFGSSRARPSEGPDQPPPMSAMRRAESMLFCSMYDLRFCVANSVTSNILLLLAYYLIFTSASFQTKKNCLQESQSG